MASRHCHAEQDTATQVVPHQSSRAGVRRATHAAQAGKIPAVRGRTVASALARLQKDVPSHWPAASALIAAAGASNPSRLTALDVAAACERWRDYAPSSRRGYHCHLRHCLTMLGAPIACWSGIPHVMAPDPRGVTVSEQAFEATLAQADAGTAFCLLACRDAALRSGTDFRLTLANFTVEGAVSTRTKGGRWVTVPVSDRLRTLVEAARSARAAHVVPDTPVYKILGMIQHRGGLKGGAMTRRLHAAQKRAGTTGWCWHDLRRTAAHRLYAGTRDLRDAQSLLGHQNLGTTLHYLWSEIRTLDPTKLAICASGKGNENAA